MVQAGSHLQIEELPQRRWMVEDYHRMIAAGILTSNDRVELLEGRIVEMVPQEPPHAATTSSFGNDFVLLFAGKAWVRQQLPLTIAPNSEPEPDIAVVRIDPNRYRDRHPTPDNVYLLIEISSSTLNYDRDRKAKVYAAAQISEYWIVDVNQKQVLVLREPQGETYHSQQTLGATAKISPLAFPDLVIDLSNLFL